MRVLSVATLVISLISHGVWSASALLLAVLCISIDRRCGRGIFPIDQTEAKAGTESADIISAEGNIPRSIELNPFRFRSLPERIGKPLNCGASVMLSRARLCALGFAPSTLLTPRPPSGVNKLTPRLPSGVNKLTPIEAFLPDAYEAH